MKLRALAYRAEHTQRTDEDKLLGNHVQLPQRIDEVFGLQIIHQIEFVLVHTLRHTGTMDNIIKLIVGPFMSRELCPQFIGVRKVQFEEMYLAVTQILAAAGRTYTRPHTELALQRLLHDETSDKSACSCN